MERESSGQFYTKHWTGCGTPARAETRQVHRAHIIWRYQAGESVSQIARALKTTRKSVLKWIDKALQMGGSRNKRYSEQLRFHIYGFAPELTGTKPALHPSG